jgi:hypothetical protein
MTLELNSPGLRSSSAVRRAPARRRSEIAGRRLTPPRAFAAAAPRER